MKKLGYIKYPDTLVIGSNHRMNLSKGKRTVGYNHGEMIHPNYKAYIIFESETGHVSVVHKDLWVPNGQIKAGGTLPNQET